MKKLLSLFIVAVLVLSAGAGAFAEEQTDEALIQSVVERFLLLTKIPRPSHHEERISKYLYEWAAGHGFSAEQDAVGNVIYDVPAMPGMEELPLVVLQAHMDMVCVAAEGVAFDPLNDPIKPIVTDETITADGTSLGADDGIGVALSMCVADGLIAHGPIRIIYTVNEEDGMDGMFGLDKKYVADAHYLINLDAEQSDSIITSTASGVRPSFTAPVDTEPVTEYDTAVTEYDTAVTVTVRGLLGGHSGIDIDKGRVNATRNLAELLFTLRSEGIDFAVASFAGGSAYNAIPASAKAVLAIRKADEEKLNAVCASWQADMDLLYQATDPDLSVLTEAAGMPEAVLAERSLNDALGFATRIPDGVHTMSPDIAGLVESSSNLGFFSVDAEGMSAVTYIRSSDPVRQEELLAIQNGMAASRGYTVTSAKAADPWKFNPDSRLMKLAREAYYELNGEELAVQALHAGLECGTFAVLNPELDMIAMGPDLHDVHTPKETCVLGGIPKTYRLLERLLASVSE